MNPDVAAEEQANGAIIVDVREDSERQHSLIPGSVHVPLSNLPEGCESLPRDSLLILQCAHGVRSQRAAWFLIENGWPNVANLQGGIVAWHEMGLPLEP